MPLTTMTDYIYATPKKILENIANAEQLIQPIIELYTKKEYHQITFVASGSSYTAINCAKGYICELLHTDVNVVYPYTFSQYNYRNVKDDHFVVIVTQSGASTNCIEALKKLAEIKHEKIVLTGNVESDCKLYADFMLDWGCGIETMGYVTLGVVSLIVYLMLFAAFLSQDKIEYTLEQIKKAMLHHKTVCDDTIRFIHQHYQSLMQMDRVYVLGVGCNYGTALEGSLKIGETLKVLAVGYEQDEFLHGPALQLSPFYTVFVIDSGDQTKDHALKVFKGLLKVVKNTYMISPSIDHPHVLKIKNPCDEPFTCLYHLPFFQLIAEVLSTDLNSKRSHPLYYEMNKIIDFRTLEFRKTHKVDEDEEVKSCIQ